MSFAFSAFNSFTFSTCFFTNRIRSSRDSESSYNNNKKLFPLFICKTKKFKNYINHSLTALNVIPFSKMTSYNHICGNMHHSTRKKNLRNLINDHSKANYNSSVSIFQCLFAPFSSTTTHLLTFPYFISRIWCQMIFNSSTHE